MKNFFNLFSLLLVVSLTSCQKYSGTCTINSEENGHMFYADTYPAPPEGEAYVVHECKCEDGEYRRFKIIGDHSLRTSLLSEDRTWAGIYTFTVVDDKITGVKSHSFYETSSESSSRVNTNNEVITGTATVDENGTIIID